MEFLRRTEDYLKADQEHILHPASIVGEVSGLVFTQGRGIFLRDTEGKEYIDCASGAANVNVGHGRRELAEAARDQMAELGYVVTFGGQSHTAVVECAEKLAQLTPQGLKRFYFCSGGSEAVESALKLVRYYWRNQGANKYKIISLYGAYHGATFGATTATGMGRMWKNFDPLVPGFLHIPRYYCYRCQMGLSYPSCHLACAHYLEEVIKSEGADTVAAFIAEPVQGAGGMIPPPPEYWPIIRDICTRYQVLLITDEVITGFGRTGKMFAVEHWGINPDLMTMAKGITSGYLPMAAVAMTQQVYDGLKVAGTPFPHLYTYSGHPVCCAVAIKNMEILVEERLVENSARVGGYMQERLKTFLRLPVVGDVGGLGLMAGVEMVTDKATKKSFDPAAKIANQVILKGREKGLLLRAYGDRLALAPPLIITQKQVDQMLDAIEETLTEIRPG